MDFLKLLVLLVRHNLPNMFSVPACVRTCENYLIVTLILGELGTLSLALFMGSPRLKETQLPPLTPLFTPTFLTPNETNPWKIQ